MAVYEQCGSDKWTGSTCCEDGLECVVMGKSTCYSQVRKLRQCLFLLDPIREQKTTTPAEGLPPCPPHSVLLLVP